MAKSKAPAITLAEAEYLQRLADEHTVLHVRLIGDEEYVGSIEFFDVDFIRLTREDGPNLFIYKHDIKYLYEAGEK